MCALRDILFCVVLVTAALVLKKMMKELLFVFLVMAAILVGKNKRYLTSLFCSFATSVHYCCPCPLRMMWTNNNISIVHFVFPIQIMRRYLREYFLLKLDIFMIARRLFNENDRDSNLLDIVL